MISHLKQFKAAYQPYNNFWEQWKAHNISELTTLEIYVVEIHRKNNFVIEPEDQIMFYNQAKLIEQITGKLNKGYYKYQDWVMQKFMGQFIRMVGFPDFEIKCALPILLLDLNVNLKNKLAQLNAKSVFYFFEEQGKDKWRDKENFMRLQSVVLELSKISVSDKVTYTKKQQHE